MANEYGNYATLNPLNQSKNTAAATISNGNLKFGSTSTSTIDSIGSTLLIPTEDQFYYFELTYHNPDTNYPYFMVHNATNLRSTDNWRAGGASYNPQGNATTGEGVTLATNHYYVDGSDTKVSYSSSAYNSTTNGDVRQIRFNGGTGEIQTDVNNSGTYITIDTLPAFGPFIVALGSGNTNEGTINFGATAFAYGPESGDKLLATQNLPEPAVINYEDEYYIQAGISHSNGSTTAVTLPKTVSGGAMARIKRTDSAGDWYVVDTVRGANKFFLWNDGAVEDTSTWSDQNLTGTTLTLPSALATGTYLIEVFFEGSYFDIDLNVGTGSAKAVAHSMGNDVGFGYWKNRETAGNGGIAYHASLGGTKWMFPPDNRAVTTSDVMFNNVDATSSAATVGTASNVNENTKNIVRYLWANSGPYAFGRYTGNLNADGPMITLNGFPQTVLIKRNENSWDWALESEALQANNVKYDFLRPNQTTAVTSSSTTNEMDFLSNGFKIRDGDNNSMNGSGIEHLYFAFGIQPLTDGAVNQGRAK